MSDATVQHCHACFTGQGTPCDCSCHEPPPNPSAPMAWTERPDDPGLYVIADTGEIQDFGVVLVDADPKTMERLARSRPWTWWLRIPEPPVREGM